MYEKIDNTTAYGDREIIDAEALKKELKRVEDEILNFEQMIITLTQNRDAINQKLSDLKKVGVEPTIINEVIK